MYGNLLPIDDWSDLGRGFLAPCRLINPRSHLPHARFSLSLFLPPSHWLFTTTNPTEQSLSLSSLLIFRCCCERTEYTKLTPIRYYYLRGFISQTLLSKPDTLSERVILDPILLGSRPFHNELVTVFACHNAQMPVQSRHASLLSSPRPKPVPR